MHRTYRKRLHLLLYDELAPEERETLEKHVAHCEGCRTELEDLMKMNAFLAGQPPLEVNDELLAGARQDLRAALRYERNRSPLRAKLIDALHALLLPGPRMAFGGAAALAIGIFVGRTYLTPSPQPATATPLQPATLVASPDAGEPHIANLHFLHSPTGDEVEFTFDAVTPVHMKGGVDDPRIQKVLAHAIVNADNPGVRLHAVSAFNTPSAGQSDLQTKAALLLALRDDENPGVRREALKALTHYPFDAQLKDALLNTLMHDKNPGLRIAAINMLDTLGIQGSATDQDVLTVLRAKAANDDNNYIRLKARAALLEAHQR